MMSGGAPLDPTIDSNDEAGGAAGASAPGAGGARGLPSQIGDYRIVGLLGEGGMGVVYEAEQPSPRRSVALKVIRGAEFVDDVRLKMFEREAATLARLDHPNIGRIYESGRTAEGRHYFAMELVRGPSLGEWLAQRSSTPDRAEIETRLRLFRQICEAVQYAHQRGVIHRDLKPSNLIVTDAAASGAGSSPGSTSVVKILDFGLARITEEDVAATQVTEVGVIKGTLPYMAPEQARGEVGAIDVRTDVYALGVILYELLTRARPYSVETGSLLSAVKIICDQAPRSLGEVWNATTRLDPDLTTIVATALEKDPEQRYATAAAFGDDVERFLASQPILARPPSTMYQLKKLVARRKPLFATAAAALVLLVAAAIGMSVLYVKSEANLARALEAEGKALREAETAERASSFLVDLFNRADPEHSRGATVTAREVMEDGARRIETELAGEPLMQARLLHTIGEVVLSLGQYDEAARLVEKASALRREHLGSDAPEIAETTQLLARILAEKGDRAASFAAYEESIRGYEKLGDEGAAKLAGALGNYAWSLGEDGEFAKARAAIERAIRIVEQKTPENERGLANLLNNEGSILTEAGKPDSALLVLERARALAEKAGGPDDFDAARIYTNLGVAHSQLGDFEKASNNAVAALAIYRKHFDEAHPYIAKELGNAGIYLAQQGKRPEARPYFEEALAAMKRIHGPENPRVAQSLVNLGLLKLEMGDAKGAIAELQQSADLFEKTIGSDKPQTANAYYHLANARGSLGEWAESERLLRRVVAIDEKVFGSEAGEVADDLEALVVVLRALGKPAEAERAESRMNAIRAKLQPPGESAP